MQFGHFARLKRLEAGLSQDAVAAGIGFAHRSNVHRLETDQLEWKLREVVKFAGLLGVRASELLAEYESQAP